MKTFFTAFYKSIYDITWLKAQRSFPGRAWKYFALLTAVVSLVALLPIAYEINSFSRNFKSVIQDHVPDFDARLLNGKLTVSKMPQPFVYTVPNGNFLIAVDTSGATSTPAVVTSMSSLYVTASQLQLYDVSSGETRTQSWSGVPNYDFTRQDLLDWATRFMQWRYLTAATIAFAVAGFIGLFVGKLYSVFVVSLVVSVAARLLGKPWKWKELFTVSLYATTLPTLISLVFTLTGLQFGYIHFIALLAFMLAAVFTKDDKEPVIDTSREM